MRYLTTPECRQLKTKLTRDLNRFEEAKSAFLHGHRTDELRTALRTAALKLESTANEALYLFDHEVVAPDSWSRWETARYDAEVALQHY